MRLINLKDYNRGRHECDPKRTTFRGPGKKLLYDFIECFFTSVNFFVALLILESFPS